MRELGIDIETFSSVNLQDAGVYRYIEAEDFEIMLFAYSVDRAPAIVVDLASWEDLPAEIFTAITDAKVIKTAFNASFELACIAKHFNLKLDPAQWECTMTRVAQLGLPLSLDGASKALKLPIEKDTIGKALIKYFSKPCEPSKVNGGRLRNLPTHDATKWESFKSYCVKDVNVEQEIRKKIEAFQMPALEKQVWNLDQDINGRGILIDNTFVNNAVQFDAAYKEKLTKEAIQITNLQNPNSGAQLKSWLSEATGEDVKSLTKKTIPGLLESADSDAIKRVLEIRQEMGKTSVTKYVAMQNARCKDSRVRGLLQYYGANRTGRWAGRLVQVQNLPRNEMPDLDLARETVLAGDLSWAEILFGNVPDTLSQLIRTAFIAKPGNRLIAGDFSAIEARVIAWLAGEQWRLDVFNTHGKIYEASAAQMFKIPIESITKGSDLRQKGKVSELALGYQGGPNALITMGALSMGLTEKELPALVKMWRNANRAIAAYWQEVEDAVIEVMRYSHSVELPKNTKVFRDETALFIQLPSGRSLSYYEPMLKQELVCFFKYKIDANGCTAKTTRVYPHQTATSYQNRGWGEISGEPFIKYALTYMSLEKGKWTRIDTYGGKLVENIVQAVARDLLAEAMLRLNDVGYNIVMHIHDEVVLEVPNGFGSIEEVNMIMGKEVSWAKGLPLKAESYETPYYKKD